MSFSYIGPITENIINTVANELKKKDTRKKISNHIITPVMEEVIERTYPYMFIFVISQVLIILLLIYLVFNIRAIRKAQVNL